MFGVLYISLVGIYYDGDEVHFTTDHKCYVLRATDINIYDVMEHQICMRKS